MSNSGPYLTGSWVNPQPKFPPQFDLNVIEQARFVHRSALVGALIRDVQFYTLESDRLTHVNGLPISSLSTDANGDIGHLIESASLHISSGYPFLDLTVWFGGRMVGLMLDEQCTITVARTFARAELPVEKPNE